MYLQQKKLSEFKQQLLLRKLLEMIVFQMHPLSHVTQDTFKVFCAALNASWTVTSYQGFENTLLVKRNCSNLRYVNLIVIVVVSLNKNVTRLLKAKYATKVWRINNFTPKRIKNLRFNESNWKIDVPDVVNNTVELDSVSNSEVV